jgi:hypothetical protein
MGSITKKTPLNGIIIYESGIYLFDGRKRPRYFWETFLQLPFRSNGIEWGDDRNNALNEGKEGYYGFFIKILF